MDLILHIGTGKAGSTSLQLFCRDNRARLAELGVLYPVSPGNARHGRLSMSVKSDAELALTPAWHRLRHSDPSRLRRATRRRLLEEVALSGPSRLLLSDEELFGLSDQSLHRLRGLTRDLADRLRVVVYLRRQDDHMVSRYQQGVKIGWVVRLSDWADTDMSSLYRYDTRLGRHEEIVAPTETVVRRFERSGFVGGTLEQDFLSAAGVPARAADLSPAPVRNESLDAESVEFLRLLNLHRVQQGAAVGVVDNRRQVRLLAAASTGPTLTLPEPVLDRFMARWQDANAAVARRYFGDHGDHGDHGDDLFTEPRRTRRTTTDQRLDPARLEHFLTVSDLAEADHAALRRLAEREAAG